MFSKNLTQKLTIFSDGSLLFDLNSLNKTKKIVKKLDKDLKIFQKNFKKKISNSLSKSNNTNIYRKKYF